MRGLSRARLFLVVLAVLPAGCSGDRDATLAQVSPKAAADQAIAEYDANKDGGLDEKELEGCPGLLAAFKRADTQKDGRLTADELADRLAYFQQGMTLDVSVEATLDGKPLAGATVTLVPEKFMGPTVRPATATTDDGGSGVFQIDGGGVGVVAPGYYRVQVSKTVQGRETIPARYNAQTVLGQEVVPEAEGRSSSLTVRLRLTGR